jgi:hypothetical protein
MRASRGALKAGTPATAKLLHQSVALLLDRSKESSPEQAIRSEARRVVAYARSLGWSGPPFDLRQLASILGIRDRSVPGMVQDALIRPRAGGDGFEILWNPDVPETRRNFTFGHEISHTFFPDCASAIQYRDPLHRCDPKKPIEVLCDLGAAELLLPAAEFGDHVNDLGVSLGSLESLRERYVASREAVARRMVTLAATPCAVAFVSCRLSPREIQASRQLTFPGAERPHPKYRIDMMFASATFGAERLPHHKSLPDDSCVYRAAALATPFIAGVADDVERWPSGHGVLPPCRVYAMTIPPNGAGERRAIALLSRVGRQ